MSKHTCKKCKEEKNTEDFSKDRYTKSGLNSRCKFCLKEYKDANKEKIKESSKKYREENKDKILEINKKYREANREKERQRGKKYEKEYKAQIKERKKKYYKENQEKIAAREKIYREVNKKSINERKKHYQKERRKKDHLYKLKASLRNRLYNVIKNKNKRTEEYLGATFKEVKIYIEKMFQEGMTWENYGNCEGGIPCDSKWHIDHIIPLSSAKTIEEVYKLCHYTNLQPLWGTDNLEKSNRCE